MEANQEQADLDVQNLKTLASFLTNAEPRCE